MKLTQSQIIMKVLEVRKDWVPSYELMKVSTGWGWIGSSGDRRARELAEAGKVEVRHQGKYAEYRVKPVQIYQLPPDWRPVKKVEVGTLTLGFN